MPKVSVVMSVYNKAPYLREAVDSVLNQTFGDFEFIITDNCSTDDSVDIIRSYDDPRIRFYQNHRNIWAVASINSCYDKATGEYVALVCGDDLWEKDFLETTVALLDGHPSINVAVCRTHSIDTEGNITRVQQQPGGDYRVVPADQVLQRLTRGCYLLITAAVFRRKDFPLFAIKYHYSGDWDIFFKMAEAGSDLLYIEKPLAYYRCCLGSNTSVAKRDGLLVFESYLTLNDFFLRQPRYRNLQKKAFSILSMSTLRLSRDLDSRQSALYYHRLALLIYPAILLHPAFYLYMVTALLFGPSGLQAVKKVSRKATSVIKKIQGKR